MSQLLQGFTRLTGAVSIVDATKAPDNYSNGLPVDLSALAVDTLNPTDYYHQGLPFTQAGRLAVEIDGVVDSIQPGGMPLSAGGLLALGTGIADHYSAGIPYTVNGQVQTTSVFFFDDFNRIGPEIWTNPPDTVADPWVDNGNGSYSIDGSQGGTAALTMNSPLVASERYSCTFEVYGYVAGAAFVRVGSVEGAQRTANGIYTEVITVVTGTNFSVRANTSFDGSVRNISFKQLDFTEDLADSPHWTWDGNGDEDNAQVVDNALATTSATPSGYLAPSTGSADHYVTWSAEDVTGTNSLVCVRFIDVDNYIGARYSGGNWTILQRLAGVNASQGSAADTPTSGDIGNLSVIGQEIELRINGTAIVSATLDSTVLDTVLTPGFDVKHDSAGPWIDDFSTGPVTYGPELIVNGDFDTDLSGWESSTNWFWSAGTAEHVVGFTNSLVQDALVIGVKYLLEYEIIGVTTGAVRIRCGSGSNGEYRSTNGFHTEILTCSGNTELLVSPQTAFDGSVDNVSVKQIF